MFKNTNLSKMTVLNGSNSLIFLSWLLYTVSYLGKVNYSANITQIVEFYGISKAEAGSVPSFFFFAYGAGQVINGLLCKKYNIKWMIFISLFISAVINLLIAVTTEFYIIKWLWMVNGFVLSILWPTLVRLLTESLPQKALGKSSVIMGTTVATGTLIIYGLSSVFVMFNMFKLSFYTAAVTDTVVAFLWFFYYKKAVGMAVREKSGEAATEMRSENPRNNKDTGYGKKSIYLSVVILCIYAIIVNLTKDGLTTWVPSILKEEFSISDSLSILLTLMLPIIAIFGNLGALKLSYKIPDYVTQCIVVFSVLGGFIGVIIASISLKLIVLTLVGLVTVNFFASSLNSLITSIFPMFMRGKVNSGLFAGVLNGFCYIGSTISAYGLGFVADCFGWLSVFWILILCCVFAGLIWCIYYFIKRYLIKYER